MKFLTPQNQSLLKASLEIDRNSDPLKQVAAPASRRRENMEIIEIPDDNDGDAIITVNSSSEGSRSSVVSDVEYLSDFSPRLDPIMEEDFHSQSPPLGDDGFWLYGLPQPHQDFNGNPWEGGLPEPVSDAIDTSRRSGHRELDWGELLGGTRADGQAAERSPPLGFGLSHLDESANHVVSLKSLAESNGDPKLDCVDTVLAIFPDICRDYVSELYETGIGEIADQLIVHILDKLEKGTEYPKAKEKSRNLKRKRDIDEDEEAVNRYGNVDRESNGLDYANLTRNILSEEFPQVPMTHIVSTLSEAKFHLFPAYQLLEEAERNWKSNQSPYQRIKKPRTTKPRWTPEAVRKGLISEISSADTMLVLRELQAARRLKKKADDKRQAEKQAELEEEENIQKAIAEGTMLECGCCFSDYPLNRMVHCDNDHLPHWFCRGCARQTAETEIGNSKYKIKCMSMDDCESGFSRDMKSQFLDDKTTIALDRNEQEEMLRLAGIENLASCPFCPFAAEYPPVEEDREFRCQAPDCEKVSCRLCKLESHIPKTCEETARDNGLSVRRQIEEAMSAALIRKCNKCETPFVKEEGCNKMTCTRSGCFNVQCYVCSKSCSYDHFNDRTRGGKPGNCPLFESVEERHQEEVSKAEKETLAKVRAAHPELTEEDLKVKVSDNVRKDDERRKAADPRNQIRAALGNRVARDAAGGYMPHGRVWPGIPEPPVPPGWMYGVGGNGQPPAPRLGQRVAFPDPPREQDENKPQPNQNGRHRIEAPIPQAVMHGAEGNIMEFEADVNFMLGYFGPHNDALPPAPVIGAQQMEGAMHGGIFHPIQMHEQFFNNLPIHPGYGGFHQGPYPYMPNLVLEQFREAQNHEIQNQNRPARVRQGPVLVHGQPVPVPPRAGVIPVQLSPRRRL